MPRLINYGIGEIVDRLSILALKILHAGSRPTDHFVRERNALLAQLRGRTLNAAWFEHAVALGAVNAAIWSTEDELRGYREGDLSDSLTDLVPIRRIAFRLQALNDERSRLIEAINRLTGDHVGSEKLFLPQTTEAP